MEKLKKKNYLTFIFFIVIASLFLTELVNASEVKNVSNPKIERHFIFDTVPLNLEEIVSLSGKIFTGIPTKIEEIDKDPESNLPVFKYTFRVIEGIKDTENDSEITFKQWKATKRNAGYEKGKKYVLFLHPESNLGLTSPVGFLQGQFEVETEGLLRKKEVVRNKTKNIGLNRNLKTQKKVVIDDDFLNNYLHSCSEKGIPMRYKEFVKTVRHLVEQCKESSS